MYCTTELDPVLLFMLCDFLLYGSRDCCCHGVIVVLCAFLDPSVPTLPAVYQLL